MTKYWPKQKLITLCDKIGDGLHGTPEYSENSDIYFVNGNNLVNGKVTITKETKKVTDIELQKNFISLNSNTLLLAINGTIGNMAFYNNEKIMLGKSSAYLNFKSPINKFYYYYFQLDGVQKYFYNVATGSTIKNLSLGSLQDFEVPVPEENEWENIVKLLSSLDLKIEMNNKICKLHERTVRLIYDYWFKQFDFPDQDNRPYKSSGGVMVFSKELNRDIPVNWAPLKLIDVFEFEKGTEPGSTEYSEDQLPGYRKYYRVGDIEEDSVTYVDGAKHSLKFVAPGDVVVTFDGTVGKIGIVLNGAISGGLRHIYDKTNKLNSSLVWSIFGDQYINNTIHKYATGSVLLHASSSIDNLVIPYNEKVYMHFQSVIQPFYDQIIALNNESKELGQIRDWLLPLLMSGRVKVVS